MIDLDRLLAMQEKTRLNRYSDTYPGVTLDYLMITHRSEILEALVLARKAAETLRVMKGLEEIKRCLLCGNDAPLYLLVDDITKLAALLGK